MIAKRLASISARWPRLPERPWFQNLLCLVLLAGLTYLFLWRLWASAPAERGLPPEDSDLTLVFYPPRYYAAQTLASGAFPLWNPHVYAGYPQFADPQAATFYPIALGLAWITGNHFNFNTILFDIGLHYFLVGAFTFLFLRRILSRALPALAGAMAYEFGGYISGYPASQLSELEAAVWLPATLWALTEAIERRSLKWTLAAGISFGMVFLAGRPQSYLTIAPVSLAWLIYLARRNQWNWRRLGGHVLLFLGTGIAISAVQWLPTLELVRLSSRVNVTYSLVSEGGFPAHELLGAWAPQLVTKNLYVGELTLVLAALAVCRRRGYFWAALGAALLLVSLGKHLILLDVLYMLQRLAFPGFLRNVERLSQGITFCLAVLGATGLDQLRFELKRVPRPILAATAAGAGIVLFTVTFWTTMPKVDPFQLLNVLTTCGLLFGLGLLVLQIGRSRRALVQAGWVALIALDVLTVNQGRFYQVNGQSESFGYLKYAALAPRGQDSFYRLEAGQLLAQDLGSVLGVDTFRGISPISLRAHEQLTRLDEYRRNILLNVEIIMAYGGQLTDPAYQLIQTVDGWQYYRFLPANPRAYLVSSVREVSDMNSAAAQLTAPDFNLWTMAVVTGQTGFVAGPELAPEETVHITSRTANDLALEVTTTYERFLVVSETYYPGWVAQLDGQSTPIYQTNISLRGVRIPPGQHRLVMSFRPPLFYIGLTLSLLTLVSVLGWWLRDAVRHRSAAISKTQAAPLENKSL